MNYYLLSVKHTNKRDAFITLWRANECGYTLYQEAAGLYALGHAEAVEKYNNYSAVKVHKDLLTGLWVKDHLENDHGILNTPENWAKFGVLFEM